MNTLDVDKQIELINDVIDRDVMSDCCGAAMYLDICMDCKEHCGIAEEE